MKIAKTFILGSFFFLAVLINPLSSNADIIEGTQEADVLDFSSLHDDMTIDGLGGNDTITSGYGNDTIYGGTGNDTINPGAGTNNVYGDEGDDTIEIYSNFYSPPVSFPNFVRGGLGNDTINDYGGSNTYEYAAGDGQDTISDVDIEGPTATDILKLVSIDPADVGLSVIGNDLEITFAGSSDKITIQHWEVGGETSIERYEFDDGTVWTHLDIIALLNNTPPVADAGIDQMVTKLDTVNLDAGGSSDIDGDILSYQWSFISAPDGTASSLSNSTVSNPTFVPDTSGIYELQVAVNDGSLSDSDNVIITVNPIQVTVPNLIGVPITNAQSEIEDSGLVVGALDYDFSDIYKTADIVMSQYDTEGTVVDEGTVINLVVTLPPPLTILYPTDGEGIRAKLTGVYGEFSGLGGVVVNGIPAYTNGNKFFVNNLPLLEDGSNTITATETTPDGTQYSDEITVTIETKPYIQIVKLDLSLESGLASLTTVLTTDKPSKTPLKQGYLKFEGPGVPDVNCDDTGEKCEITFPVAGQYIIKYEYIYSYYEEEYHGMIMVDVHDKTIFAPQLISKWNDMKGDFINDDKEGSLSFFAKDSQNKFSDIFNENDTSLRSVIVPSAIKNGRDIEMITMENGIAEYRVKLDLTIGSITQYINFVIDEDGLWKIHDIN